ncbi:hypothetical protein EMIHUDRAFT_203087 [Emiliania huxleyi CCMP1516]|uniref:Ribosomal RNA large subunit methyltransferase K/L-like methyltransferase domain-containing protein n=2 Tax=Emiliania huxleyi TaxID=2903 RepID=A0A0D3K5I2_EMIH1|nr:hypothetical protein EMIHUDRAFT_203087 [Emiliania huxleyi CCMP1516]EOD31017.1 hypothetical protein EMIHUDRAFT_203087 [Emiliania huxleyi CCMP1516]|eukprot:XP_005783446.1 hypothetical protein EMIHUDRAFT_203087 [Emiliania huxleyi CCMP1516]
MTTLRTLLATPLVLVALLAATPSRAVRLSPGAPASAAARPRFLFLYRDTLPGHWRSEVRSVADMLGFGGDELAFEPSRRDSFEYGSGQRAWERLAEAVCAAGAETHRRWVAPLAEDSWCVEMLSAGRQKPYSEPAKARRDGAAPLDPPRDFATFRGLLCTTTALSPPPPPVVAMLEDYDDPTGRGERGEPAALAPPRRLYLGRRLSAGASRLLHDFRLSARGYLGRTTLPPELAFLMANEARARPGCALLDPFCGTCSTLLSAARFGATTFGVEVDARAGELYQPLPARCAMLLRLAAARLRVGGRLVFLLPVPAECAAPALPPSDCLVLESASRHAVSARMHRYLLTLRKAREASAADVGEARVSTLST